MDGDYNSDVASGSCSWTNKEFQPWWKVDLGQSFNIYEIVITNREDCCRKYCLPCSNYEETHACIGSAPVTNLVNMETAEPNAFPCEHLRRREREFHAIMFK